MAVPAPGAVADSAGVSAASVAAHGPTRVRFTVAGHSAAAAAGVSGVIVQVARADGSNAAGRVGVQVDYGSWADAFGGQFADRLALVRLPACALTTPTVAACRTRTPVPFVNDRRRQALTAQIALPAGTGGYVLAAVSTPGGTDGSYAATSLKSSDSWTVSGNTGSFAWSYPVTVPASIGSGAPSIAVAYDSSSVDGRTTVSNGQTSTVGEGFDIGGASSFIETSYEPCSRVNPTDWASTGDLCQGTANATVSGGSHAGQLVRDDATGQWRLSTDDGTRVQLLYGTEGGSNNTANQAYWKLTATDGTVFIYGANRLPQAYGGTGADAPTYSTWSEPVFGTGSGTSCNDPTGTESAQSCLQAWRWNLDFVVDPHGNVTRYTYARELDNYEHGTTTTAYTRSGYLREIDYGWQTSDLASATGLLADHNAGGSLPGATVLWGYAPRCASSASGCPAGPITVSAGVATTGISSSNATAFTDVPYDEHCDAGSSTCANYGPSFWSTVRLTTIQTAVNNGAAIANQPSWTPSGYEAVDAYSLAQSFPVPQDNATTGNRPQLRLEAISDTGYVTNADGTVAATSTPSVNFAYTGTLPNRVVAGWNKLSSTSQFYRFRLTEITDELGSDTVVNYGQPNGLGCSGNSSAPAATTANSTLCFPEYYNDSGANVVDWYNKYVVTGVSVYDDTLRGTGYVYDEAHATNYTYLGKPAWHTNDSELTPSAQRTVDQFRGFRQVETDSGTEAAGHNTKTVTTYFQGMDQDPTGYVCLNDSHSQGPVTSACPQGGYRDDNALAGQALEVQQYASETSNSVVSDSITVPEDPTDAGMVTATHVRASGLPTQRAHFSHPQKKITYDLLASGGLRRSEIDYAYENSLPSFTGSGAAGGNGRLVLTDNKGDTDGSGTSNGDVQELCTVVGYAANTSRGVDGFQMTAYPDSSTISTVPSGQTCSASEASASTTTTQGRTFYDGLPFGQVGGTGDVTAIEAASAYGGPWVTTQQAKHDQYGRATSGTDADGDTTATTYIPATGLLPRQVRITNPMGWTATSTLDRGSGVALANVDVNGRESDAVYDGLGRVTEAWTADHSKSANPSSPNVKYTYSMSGAAIGASGPAPNAYVETQTLREDVSYGVSFSILDGFGDQIETQATPADGSGLVSTQVEYNSLGKPVRTASAHWDATDSPSGTFLNYGDALPSQTVTTYDGLSRPLTVATYHNGVLVPGMVSTTAYPGADRTDATGPAGDGVASASAESTFTDVRGRTTAVWTYHNSPPKPTGNAADADILSYAFAYVANGTMSTVTDGTTKNVWTTTTTDLLGHHTTTVDPDTGTGKIVLDDAGRTVQTTDGRGKTLSFSYDSLGRQTAEYDAAWVAPPSTPAASTKLASWVYDTTASTDGKTDRGLPTSSTSYTDNGATAYVSAVTGYDAAGRSTGTAVTVPNADGNGNLAGTYKTGYSYTPVIGLLDHTDLPAAGNLPAETVYNSYNVNGLLLGTGGNANYVVATQYDQLGEILSRTLGDYTHQVVQQSLYDAATGRVTNTFVDATAGRNANNSSQLNAYSVDDSSFTYDAAGRLTSVADLQNWSVSGSYNPGPAQRDNQCYTYDYAGRVTNAWADSGDQTPSATTNLNSPTTATGGLGSCADSTSDNPPTSASALGGPAPYWQTYTFDATGAAGLGNGAVTGNRSSIVDHDPSGNTAKDVTRTSSYPAAGTTNTAAGAAGGSGPHLPASVTAAGGASGTDTYTYDGAGDLTGRKVTTQGSAGNATESLTWNDQGELATDSNATTNTTSSFVYDATGTTLIRRDYTTGTQAGTVTLYLGDTQLKLTTASGAVTGLRYYEYAGAPTIVADNLGNLTYEVGNTQGTAGTTVNAANGQVEARRYFTPYGAPRGAAATQWPDDHTFLGDPTDQATGLTTIGARTYDAQTGRFISADPVFESTDQNQLGGFAYAGDDPVSASDPTGRYVPVSDGDSSSSSSAYVPTVQDPEACATELCYDELTQEAKGLASQSRKQADALSGQADNCASDSCYHVLNAAADAQRAGGYVTTANGDVVAPSPSGGVTVYTPKSVLAAMQAPPKPVEAAPKKVHCGWSITCRIKHSGIVKTIAKAATWASDVTGDIGGVVGIFCQVCGEVLATGALGFGLVAAGADAYEGEYGEAGKVLLTAGIGMASFGVGSLARLGSEGKDAAEVAEAAKEGEGAAHAAEEGEEGIGVGVKDGVNGGFVESIRSPETELAKDPWTGVRVTADEGFKKPSAAAIRAWGTAGVADIELLNGWAQYQAGDADPWVAAEG